MTDAIIEFFRNLLNNDILTTFIIAIIPIIELRGALPVAIKMGMPWYAAFGYAYLGSIIIAPILLLLLKPVLEWMKKIRIFRSLANAVEGMFKDKAEVVAKRANKSDVAKKEDLIKMLGVFTFVALPLPLTGVWTGTAVAVFLGLGFWKSLISIMLGNLTAGAIVTLLSVFFEPYLDIILTVFLIIVVLVLIFYIVMVILKMKKNKKALSEKCAVTVNGKKLYLVKIDINEADMLHKMQVQSFQTLLDKYQDYETNPGAENLERVQKRLKDKSCDNYFIKLDEDVIGAIRIMKSTVDTEYDTCKLKLLFILPQYQNNGYARHALLIAENYYPDVDKWELETIEQEKKLCHLYEKAGYKKTGKAERIKEDMDLIIYKKSKKIDN